jgi:hypothetical protein
MWRSKNTLQLELPSNLLQAYKQYHPGARKGVDHEGLRLLSSLLSRTNEKLVVEVDGDVASGIDILLSLRGRFLVRGTTIQGEDC